MNASAKALQEAISIRRQIDTLEKLLASILGGSPVRPLARAGRRRMSAATRAKLAAAARARWARQKAGTKTTRARRKGGITAAGRKRLSQLMKARWAASRKAAASPGPGRYRAAAGPGPGRYRSGRS
jgi:hypothetical protein